MLIIIKMNIPFLGVLEQEKRLNPKDYLNNANEHLWYQYVFIYILGFRLPYYELY